MTPEIKICPEKKLVGKRLTMSLSENKTIDLWRSFMPSRKEIKNTIGSDLYSMRVYDNAYDFKNFNLHSPFDKWAAIEVSNFAGAPKEMECFTLNGGKYAVFQYKGLNTDTSIFEYIFATWLPKSDFELDHRPHFEVLGEKYRNNDPESEEEIWVPVRLR